MQTETRIFFLFLTLLADNLQNKKKCTLKQRRCRAHYKTAVCRFFFVNIFYLFSHTTSQHNIHSKQTKHNKTTNVYSLFQKSNQKGKREGDKEKKKSFLYIITYIREKTLPSINSGRLGPINSRCCTFTSHYLQEAMDPICFSTCVA